MTDSPFPAPTPPEVPTVGLGMPLGPGDADITGTLPGATTAPAGPRPKRRMVATAIAAVLGLGAAGGLVVVATGSDDGTGASSPTEAVQRLATAIDNEDFIGALDVVAPDEVDGLKSLIDAVRARAKDPKLEDALQPGNLAGGVPGILFGGGRTFTDGGFTESPSTPTTEPGAGLGLSVTLSDVVETKLADHAVAVDAQVTASVDLPSFDLGGAIDDVTGSEDTPSQPGSTADFSLRLITVQLSGGWYVSPMLTGADYAVQRSDMPGPDWSQVDAPAPTTRAGSAVEAVEAAARAIATQDLDAMIDVMGPGEARVMRVFRGAAEQLLADVDVQVTVNEVKATEVKGGAVLSLLDLTVVDADGVTRHGVWSDACITVDDEPADCMVDDDGIQRIGLQPDDLVLEVVTADGNHRVSLLGSIFGLVEHVVSTVSDQQLLDVLGLQYLDEATTIDPTTEVKGSTTAEQPYAVYEFDGEAQTSYYAEADTGDDTNFCYGSSWRQGESGAWVPEYYGLEIPAGKVRLVIQCERPTDFTFTLTPTAVEPGGFPGGDPGSGDVVTESQDVDLSQGEQTVTFDATAGQFVDVTVMSTGADVALDVPGCADCGTVDYDTTATGDYEFVSWPITSDGQQTVVITPKPGAASDASATVTIMIYAG